MATSLRVKVVIVRRDSILALGRDLSPRGSVILGAQVLDSRQRFIPSSGETCLRQASTAKYSGMQNNR